MLEVVLIAWWSAAALYSCHECVYFSLKFDSHDVRNVMVAETFVSERRYSVFVFLALIQSKFKAEKKFCGFLALQRNREFILLCSFHSIAGVRCPLSSVAAWQERYVLAWTNRPVADEPVAVGHFHLR